MIVRSYLKEHSFLHLCQGSLYHQSDFVSKVMNTGLS